MAIHVPTLEVQGSPRRRLTRERALQAMLVVTLLLAWEIVGRRVGDLFLAPPSAVAAAFGDMLRTGELARALRDSLQSLAIGFTIALLVGLVMGILIGWNRTLGQVLDPFVSGLYVVPIATLVPLLVLWFGIGMTPRIITIALFSVFEILIATSIAVREVDERLTEMARSFGANRRQMFRSVVLPGALPLAFGGIRIGAGRAVQGMITAELLFAVTGLGGLVMTYANSYRLDKVLVVVVAVSLMGVLLALLVQQLERALTPGRPEGDGR